MGVEALAHVNLRTELKFTSPKPIQKLKLAIKNVPDTNIFPFSGAGIKGGGELRECLWSCWNSTGSMLLLWTGVIWNLEYPEWSRKKYYEGIRLFPFYLVNMVNCPYFFTFPFSLQLTTLKRNSTNFPFSNNTLLSARSFKPVLSVGEDLWFWYCPPCWNGGGRICVQGKSCCCWGRSSWEVGFLNHV